MAYFPNAFRPMPRRSPPQKPRPPSSAFRVTEVIEYEDAAGK
jgi:hypothetical protein